MSANASILYLRLDENYDVVFDADAALTDLQAVAQAIETRLLLLQGEWWQDLNDGTPMFQDVIGRRASGPGLQVMTLAFSQRVSGTPYVSAVLDVSTNYSYITRAFEFKCTAQTSFGNVQVVFTPGISASVS